MDKIRVIKRGKGRRGLWIFEGAFLFNWGLMGRGKGNNNR